VDGEGLISTGLLLPGIASVSSGCEEKQTITKASRFCGVDHRHSRAGDHHLLSTPTP
jgi:hypothetical protein